MPRLDCRQKCKLPNDFEKSEGLAASLWHRQSAGGRRRKGREGSAESIRSDRSRARAAFSIAAWKRPRSPAPRPRARTRGGRNNPQKSADGGRRSLAMCSPRGDVLIPERWPWSLAAGPPGTPAHPRTMLQRGAPGAIPVGAARRLRAPFRVPGLFGLVAQRDRPAVRLGHAAPRHAGSSARLAKAGFEPQGDGVDRRQRTPPLALITTSAGEPGTRGEACMSVARRGVEVLVRRGILRI